MTVQVTTLANGLRIVTDPMNSVETVALGVWVGAGTRHETADDRNQERAVLHLALLTTTHDASVRVLSENTRTRQLTSRSLGNTTT